MNGCAKHGNPECDCDLDDAADCDEAQEEGEHEDDLYGDEDEYDPNEFPTDY